MAEPSFKKTSSQHIKYVVIPPAILSIKTNGGVKDIKNDIYINTIFEMSSP
jgi:hypothetical protein